MVITPEMLQSKQDMLEGAINQRNAAQNECIALNAQLCEALRLAKKREERVAELEARIAADVEAKAAEPKANGAQRKAGAEALG